MKLSNSKNILVGKWIYHDNQVISDEVCKRIEYLIQNSLQQVAASDDGWEILYRDASDSRYWELTYPDSDTHASGPPTLKCISAQEASKKYKI